ncbi:chemotaxis protein CheX [Desulfospira joergensenii]|uniref:chemotaxis protein CheX n=1 Tax=Desulfospira joergensenii TaxID=53329 RepID=UPI0004880EB5|nr:chemotaxis protein CheX [Desulfospira joergensenii]
MKKILTKAMENSISEVMETMFFLPVEFGKASSLEAAGLGDELMVASLRFVGEITGSVSLFAPRELVSEMGANFMGEPRENLTENHLSGTLTEMLNMVCGNALSKVKTKEPFELGIPEILAHPDIPGTEPLNIVETLSGRMGFYLVLDGS